MAARRCESCGVNYPAIQQFATCPIHAEPTELQKGVEPDEKWQEALAVLKRQHEESQKPYPILHGVECYEDNGLLWVNQGALFRAGLRLPHIAASDFRLFELDDGWVYETQGWDESHRRWWVERVLHTEEASQPTTSADDLSSTASATS